MRRGSTVGGAVVVPRHHGHHHRVPLLCRGTVWAAPTAVVVPNAADVGTCGHRAALLALYFCVKTVTERRYRRTTLIFALGLIP